MSFAFLRNLSIFYVDDVIFPLTDFRAVQATDFLIKCLGHIVDFLICISGKSLQSNAAQFTPLQLITEIFLLAFPPAWLNRPAAWTVQQHIQCACNLAEKRALWGNTSAPQLIYPAFITQLYPLVIRNTQILS